MELSRKAQDSEALPEMLLKPVGVVRNKIKNLSLVAMPDGLEWQAESIKREWRSIVSELVIDSDLSDMLDGIEDYSHLLVLYWAHCVPHERRFLRKVHPCGRKDLPLLGIFATRSPARPNPICVSTVRLLEREANVLKVEGLDAVDGSPLIDIKPYNPNFDGVGEFKMADWWIQLQKEYTKDSSPPSTSDSECSKSHCS